MNPSGAPWFVWMVCALFFWLFSLLFFWLLSRNRGEWILEVLLWVTAAAGAFVAIIGIIRFVKWVWSE